MAKDYSNYMKIETGLTDNLSLNVLKSTIGQLSDGIWENSNVANHYWEFAEAEIIDNKVCLMIKKDTFDYHGGQWCPTENYFKTRLNMDPSAIKKYFANKVRAVVRQEAKDYPEAGIKCNAKCDVKLDYMICYDNRDNHIKASDAYKVYKALNA